MRPWLIFQKLSRSDGVLLGIYLSALVVLFGTYSNYADADLWHRFALWDYLTRTGHFPPQDAFSYLSDHLAPDHEWGCAFIFYPVYFWGGGTGLVLLKLATLGGTLALSVRAGLLHRRPTMLDAFFYSLVILALLPSFLSTLRCQAFTHLFFALWVLWFQLERGGRTVPVWAYPLTMMIWANLHGGFVLGFVWLGIIGTWEFFTGRPWRRRGLIIGMCLLTTLVTPYSYTLWPGVIHALLSPQTAFEEWGPVSWIQQYKTFSSYKLLVLWTVAVLINHIRRTGWKNCDQIEVILIGYMMAISLLHTRHTSLYAVAVGGLLPPLFAPEISLHNLHSRKLWLHRFLVRVLLVILPIILALRLLPANQGLRLHYSPENCPVGAVAWLRDHGITGRLLVGFNSGSYALWELRGRMRVSMDGRYEIIYSQETFQKVQHFFAGENGWRDVLNNPPPDAILVNLPDGVYPKLRAEPDWTEAYRDATQAVFLPTTRPTPASSR